MIHDNIPHPIFKISELTRLVASQLLPLNRKTTVNLACACRYLKEPVLSALWGTQPSLDTLLEVFPEENREYIQLELGERVVRRLDPPVGGVERLSWVVLVQDRGEPVAGGLE